MLQEPNFFKTILLLVIIVLVASCGGGNKPLELPPERPFGLLSGSIEGGKFSNNTVTAYSLDKDGNLIFVENTVVNDDGTYDLSIQLRSQPIILVLTGGEYTESTTNNVIVLQENHRYTSLVLYESGQTIKTDITPFSHLATALMLNNIKDNKHPSIALKNATNTISSFYGVDIVNTESGADNPSEKSETTEAILSNKDKSQLYYSGLEQLAYDVRTSTANSSVDEINLVTLLDVMYRDIFDDGKLDGLGIVGDDNNVVTLRFGNQLINDRFYQLKFAEGILNSIKYNSYDEKPDLIKPYIYAVANTSTQDFSPNNKSIMLDDEASLLITNASYPNFSGQATIEVKLDSILRIKQSTAAFNQENIATETIRDKILISIDSSNLLDGEYDLSLNVTDEFDQTVQESFTINFDNTLPVASVTTTNITNDPEYVISGILNDEQSGVDSVLVGDKRAAVSNDGAWRTDIVLIDGMNVIDINVIDRAGNISHLSHAVRLDQNFPVFDNQVHHSNASYVSGEQTPYLEELKDNNESPLYFDLDRISLNNMEVSKNNLDSAKIAYFVFAPEDQHEDGTLSPFSSLTIYLRYFINGLLINEWDTLPIDNGHYLFPMTTQFLGSQWLDSSKHDKHTIEVELTDKAGNITSKELSFYSQFYVPTTHIAISEENPNQEWMQYDFAERMDLIESEKLAMTYDLINDSSHPFYIKLSDVSDHQLERRFLQSKKENRIKLLSTEEWRIGTVDNAFANCPTFDSNWTYVDSIWNFAEIGEFVEQFPPEIPQQFMLVETDNPVPPESTQWVNKEDLDSFFAEFDDDKFGDKLSFQYDYIIDNSYSSHSQPAMLSNWRSDLGENNQPPFIDCDNVRNFQKRTVFQIEPTPDYPRVNSQSLSEFYAFETSGFKVFDEMGAEIFPLDGWYRVPALQRISIEKYIKTPFLPLYEDQEVSDNTLITDYKKYFLDTDFIWNVRQNLAIDYSFNPPNLDFTQATVRQEDLTFSSSVYHLK